MNSVISFKHELKWTEDGHQAFKQWIEEEYLYGMKSMEAVFKSSGWSAEARHFFVVWEMEADRIDDLEKQAQSFIQGASFIEKSDMLRIQYHHEESQPHYAAVTAFVTNEKDEVLLVKSAQRSDTWELPGGRVEANETLEQAVKREVREEAGIEIEVFGVIGTYQNYNKGMIVNLAARYVSGELRGKPGEIMEARFIPVSPQNAAQWITRPHFLTRLLDSFQGRSVPYECYQAKPASVLHRLD
ncbi:NUDIX hydrolase [Marinicrinis sediminis]|uniref:NUDIX hydrolase n=1 Tax=Marinicrinis sediminis TaxID=1652465 RepID=A0ABW5RDM1_9BACL